MKLAFDVDYVIHMLLDTDSQTPLTLAYQQSTSFILNKGIERSRSLQMANGRYTNERQIVDQKQSEAVLH